MGEVHVFQHIQAPYRKSLIYTRLGYEKKNTLLEPERRKQMDRWIREAELLCNVTVIYKKVCIKVNDRCVIIPEGITLESTSLAKLLGNSEEAVIMASTGGYDIMNQIQRLQDMDEMARALVYDTAASEITDAGLDWLMAYLKQQLTREGQTLTHMRYSPGYGDLKLYNQIVFYNQLELGKAGVKITPKYMLIPEKTVTAIVGIQKGRLKLASKQGGDGNDKTPV